MSARRYYVLCPAGHIRHVTTDLIGEAMPLMRKPGHGAEVVRDDNERVAMQWAGLSYPPPRTAPLPLDRRWWS